MPTKPLIAVLLCSLAYGDASAQVDRNLLAHTYAQPYSAVALVSEDFRRQVRSDTALVAEMARWLTGDVAPSVPWDTALVVWWVAESGNPQFADALLRFLEEDNGRSTRGRHYALYGLLKMNPASPRFDAILDDDQNAQSIAHLLPYVHPTAAARAVPRIARNLPADQARGLQRLINEGDVVPFGYPCPPQTTLESVAGGRSCVRRGGV